VRHAKLPKLNELGAEAKLLGVSALGLTLGVLLRPAFSLLASTRRSLGWRGVLHMLRARVRCWLKLPPPPYKVVAKDTPIDQIVDIIRLEGCVCIENVIDEKEMAVVENELAPFFQKETLGIGGQGFGQGGEEATGRVGNIVVKSRAACDLASNPLVLEIIERILLRNCKKIRFKVMETIRMLPGGKSRQVLHKEEGLWPIAELYAPGEDYSVDAMWALTDFTNANGGTHVIPTSNLWKRGSKPDNSQPTIQANMKRGSVFLFSGSTVHAGGKNTTDRVRTGLLFGYQVGWLLPEALHVLAAPPEVAKTLPPVIQELLGYPLRFTPVSKPQSYEAVSGAVAYRPASSYAYTGGAGDSPSRLVPYLPENTAIHSYG